MKGFDFSLAQHCTPAMCGLKVSNLMSFDRERYPNLEELLEDVCRRCKHTFSAQVVKENCKRCWVLIYREEQLRRHLAKKENQDLMRQFGYQGECNLCQYIEYLKEKLKGEKFPHEIGVYLGYPKNDILHFVAGSKPKYVGYWKVYDDVEAAKRTFHSYESVREKVLSEMESGMRLEDCIKDYI